MQYKSYLVEQNIGNLNENLILFYGENLGLKNDLKKEIIKKNLDAEKINFLQDDIIKNEDFFFDELMNKSLFEQKKIYFIEQANDKILRLIEEIGDKLDNQKIFIFSEILDKRSKLRNFFENSKKCGVVPCYADNEISIKKIILNKLNGFQGLSTQNVNLIINNSNLDRHKLHNELNKIITYFTDKKIVDEKLELILDSKINENFNLLKDEALNGNKIKTNELLSDTIMESEKNILYLNLINQRLNKLIHVSKISKSENLEEAINKIRPPIFWKDKNTFLFQAKKWNSNKIQNILNRTYELEIKIKSNAAINKNILIRKLLVDICVLANT